MKLHIHYFMVLSILTFATPALTQRAGSKVTIHQAICNGYFGDNPARILGIRQLRESWGAGGDVSFIDFEGELESFGRTYPLTYSKEAHHYGVLYTNPPIDIKVLDNTGGKMVIYEDNPASFRSNKLGEFVCQWIRVQ